MEATKVDMYIMSNSKFFEGQHLPMIRERLINLEDSQFLYLQSLNLKDPTTILIISLLAGAFGVDRFMIGDTGLGIAKLLTCGGFGIWTIVDWFIIMGRTREMNTERFSNAVR